MLKLLTFVTAIVAAQNIDFEFHQYVAKYGKSYPTKEEYELRKQQFAESHAQIE